MPEEQPLHKLTLLEVILKSKNVVFIELEKIEEFCRSLHYCERRRLGIIDYDWDSTCLSQCLLVHKNE